MGGILVEFEDVLHEGGFRYVEHNSGNEGREELARVEEETEIEEARQPTPVRDVAIHLHREPETGRGALPPRRADLGPRHVIVAGVDLDGAEMLAVLLQPVSPPHLFGVEHPDPVIVVEPGRAEVERSARWIAVHSVL